MDLISFEHLHNTDLQLDAVYESGDWGNVKDDPIHRLVGCGNQGGFRYVGNNDSPNLCVLYSSLTDPDWCDELDIVQGRLTYYGDNKTPGHDLHSKKGNRVLKSIFEKLHRGERYDIPPFFVFTKGPTKRDVVFRGLAVPGTNNSNQDEDLVAIWKTRGGKRFQNYRATFSILNINRISRDWLNKLRISKSDINIAPDVWRNWVVLNKYDLLIAPKTIQYRLRNEQLPDPFDKLSNNLLKLIISFFKSHQEKEYAFEKCAVEIVRLMDSNVISCDVTRPWRDGGRDGIGEYKIGTVNSSIKVDFALEAKCKNVEYGSGVKETSRLISRIKHRQFGIFVTTSYVSEQAYKEIVEDSHPLLIISGKDITEILIRTGYNTTEKVENWLKSNFL